MASTIPDLECDLIMKGGITSGVVYPNAIVQLSRKYHFRSIGGASAGAIAAGAAAAAEYARQTGAQSEGSGMDGIATLPARFATGGVQRFFQPVRDLARPFTALMDYLDASTAAKKRGKPLGFGGMRIALRHYFPDWSLASSFFITMIAIAAAGLGAFAWVPLAILAAFLVLAGGAVAMAKDIQREVMVKLPENGFGFCSGLTEGGDLSNPALTDWLYDLFNELAGLPKGGSPLTFRKLHEQDIDVEMITTCLSMGRPFRLPMEPGIFYFQEAEFRRLFPEKVVTHMIDIAKAKGVTARFQPGDTENAYWPFPANGTGKTAPNAALDLPVVVAVRMSLSFPVLFQAVPLYAYDFSFEGTPVQEHRLFRCFFSDGGISSNFPMHFFDSPLPQRPTFGISLGECDQDDGNCEQSSAADAARVSRPAKATEGHLPQFTDLQSLGAFLGSILGSAKDWQDNMLSQIAGYRERIVTVKLNPDEGGLNLNMDGEKIERLSNLGDLAGRNLVGDSAHDWPGFDMDEHRWRRFLVTQDRVSDLLTRMGGSWTNKDNPTGTFIRAYARSAKRSFKRNTPAKVDPVCTQFDSLSQVATQAPDLPKLDVPKPACVIRIAPRE